MKEMKKKDSKKTNKDIRPLSEKKQGEDTLSHAPTGRLNTATPSNSQKPNRNQGEQNGEDGNVSNILKKQMGKAIQYKIK